MTNLATPLATLPRNQASQLVQASTLPHAIRAESRAASPGAATHASRQYLIFALNDEIYGVDIMRIREIIEYSEVTAVPMVPATIRGVINLRGAVVPLIDLSARFGHPPTQAGRRTCCVILEAENHATDEPAQTLGIVVDAVNEVLEIPDTEIEPAPAFGTHLRTDFIAGMGRIGDRFILLLDLSHVLSLDELAGLSSELQVKADWPIQTPTATQTA